MNNSKIPVAPGLVPSFQARLLTLCNERVERYGDRPALSIFQNGNWESLSYRQLRDQVECLSSHLIESGLRAGARVAILAESSPQWALAFFAALRSGAVVTPLDPKLPDSDLAAILSAVEPALIFVSDTVLPRLEALTPDGRPVPRAISLGRRGSDSAPSYRECSSSGIFEPVHRDPQETALVVYTSGSTGRPKGVRISGASLLFQVEAISSCVAARPGDRVLSILPLHHLFELTAGFLVVLWSGGEVCYSNSLMPAEMIRRLGEKPADRLLVVPLFLKLLRREIQAKAARQGVLAHGLFRLAWQLSGVLPGQALRRLLFAGVRRQFGGRLQYFVCGGAPLPREVEDFFARIGLPVYQGYGMTETSPVITLSAPGRHAPGAVGEPLAGVEVRIGERGEVLTRGPHLMQGYENNPRATAEVIDADGWLHTGDLGRLDEAGFLYVTGREKDLIVLGNGKNVWPAEVEYALESHPAIAQACVLEANDQLCAVVIPEAPGADADLRAAAMAACRQLAGYKRPSRILVRREPLPQTTTRKLKRHAIQAWAQLQGD